MAAVMQQLSLLGAANPGGPGRSISPLLELGAYEVLWCRERASFKRLSELLEGGRLLPSDLVDHETAIAMAWRAIEALRRGAVDRFGVRVHGDFEYPQGLRDARDPVELLYYQGWWNLTEMPSVAVVGSRRPSPGALERTGELVHDLVAAGWAVVSGLAEGIDTAAHRAALAAGGVTIAVLGTPLSMAYPRSNLELQREIAQKALVISQVPVIAYGLSDYRRNRYFFPQRNLTMAALSRATIIVEAGETSGTLIQARAALAQGRKLFILDRCFETPGLTWPADLEARGAVRLKRFDDLQRELGDPHSH